MEDEQKRLYEHCKRELANGNKNPSVKAFVEHYEETHDTTQ